MLWGRQSGLDLVNDQIRVLLPGIGLYLQGNHWNLYNKNKSFSVYFILEPSGLPRCIKPLSNAGCFFGSLQPPLKWVGFNITHSCVHLYARIVDSNGF